MLVKVFSGCIIFFVDIIESAVKEADDTEIRFLLTLGDAGDNNPIPDMSILTGL